MDDKLPAKTAKCTSLENLYVYSNGDLLWTLAVTNCQNFTIYVYLLYSMYELIIILHYLSKKSTDGMSAQVFESDIIETEKV